MLIEKVQNVETIVGKISFNYKSSPIFEKLTIDFFNNISMKIKNDKHNFFYKDLITFGFWCRKSNLIQISKSYKNKDKMLGKGTVLHIPPSNVPMTFAYSFAFGLLSGNNNIVRLPSKNFNQVKILIEIIKSILKKREFHHLQNKICFIRYKKSNDISENLSSKVDARLIWGGDETVKNFKKYITQPHCIDLAFPDRYSASLISISELSNINLEKFKNLVYKFYNDSYIMDQNGCSSPHVVFWEGKNNLVKNKFWRMLEEVVQAKYDYNMSITNQKLYSLSYNAIASKTNFKTEFTNFRLVKLKIKNKLVDIENLKCGYGTFSEITLNKLIDIEKYVSRRFQTLTYFGYNKKTLNKMVVENGFLGIDRIVPIGRAFDIGPVWDGHDIIHVLSKTISN